MDLFEIEASLVNLVNSRTTRVIQRDPVSPPSKNVSRVLLTFCVHAHVYVCEGAHTCVMCICKPEDKLGAVQSLWPGTGQDD